MVGHSVLEWYELVFTNTMMLFNGGVKAESLDDWLFHVTERGERGVAIVHQVAIVPVDGEGRDAGRERA